MTEEKKYAAVCIIENEMGQILLLQRSLEPFGFCLPGGKVDPGETIVQGANREVNEETGLIVNLTEQDLLGEVLSAVHDRMVYVFYRKIETSKVITLSIREHIAYLWTTRPLLGIDMAGNTDKMINLWPNLPK